jgi:hypothetical protein
LGALITVPGASIPSSLSRAAAHCIVSHSF